MSHINHSKCKTNAQKYYFKSFYSLVENSTIFVFILIDYMFRYVSSINYCSPYSLITFLCHLLTGPSNSSMYKSNWNDLQ